MEMTSQDFLSLGSGVCPAHVNYLSVLEEGTRKDHVTHRIIGSQNG